MKADNGKYFINARAMRVWTRKHKWLLKYFLVGILAGGVLAFSIYREPKVQKPVETPQITPTPTIFEQKIVPTTSPKPLKRPTSGKASYYSVAGCLGCSADRTMANGQRLDDTRATVAYNHLPLNTPVKITNVKNGLSIVVPVTDRGGFERHGKIADLSLATKEALQCGDVCTITIWEN